MNNIISALIVIVCIVAGGIAGNFLKSGSSTAPQISEGDGSAKQHPSKSDHGSESKGTHGKEESHGSGEKPSSATENPLYFKFSREFVVPILEGDRVKSLVILNISLETAPDQSQALFSMEPKLRDNMMTTLIGLSNDGVTFENLTNVESYETIRSMLLANLRSVSSTGIENVLILDMARQDL